MTLGDEASSRHRQGAVVVRLELEPGDPGEPPSGRVATEGGAAERFNGWIELMAALNAARVQGDVHSP